MKWLSNIPILLFIGFIEKSIIINNLEFTEGDKDKITEKEDCNVQIHVTSNI